MTRIREIINELGYISENPKEAIKLHKEKTGKGAVGIMPLYAPEEIVYASGYLPIGIWGAQKEVAKARTYLPPFACSIMQTTMELEIEGEYDDLDAVVFSVPCDTLKCMSQKWKGKSPAIVFTHPQNRTLESSNKFLVKEYEIFKERLENILNIKISNKDIEESIKIYNQNRKIMRKFSELAGIYPDIIDPVDRHKIIKARWYMDKKVHTKLVKELCDELEKLPVKEWKGNKVILTGIMVEPIEILNILKSEHMAIVGDDLAQESRQFRHDVIENDNCLYALAKWWQDLEGCSIATDVSKKRGRMLIESANRYNAKAVISCMMKFCDPEEFDYPIYVKELEDAGIRVLQIEIDLEMNSFEQVKTRIQSFSEIL